MTAASKPQRAVKSRYLRLRITPSDELKLRREAARQGRPYAWHLRDKLGLSQRDGRERP